MPIGIGGSFFPGPLLSFDIPLSLTYTNQQNKEVKAVAKAGMRRPDPKMPHGTQSNHINHFAKNEVPPVPELQGKAKKTKEKAKPIIHQ